MKYCADFESITFKEWVFFDFKIFEHKKSIKENDGISLLTEINEYYSDVTMKPNWKYEDALIHKKKLENALELKNISEKVVRYKITQFLEPIGTLDTVKVIEFSNWDYENYQPPEDSEAENLTMLFEYKMNKN
jgi:hypothetical protein